ncbi:MAG: diadenylate cyclase [Armatimonadota bacterium]|jgi:diadenylate cyclase|nr:diadenylate cyclase [Armatimonadota bacterium]MDT7972045.1 diadenylate cyclase [Armatimonadota bacterium]
MPEKETKRKPRKEGEELIDPTDALFGMAVQLAKQAGGVALLACVGASLLPSLQEWVGKAPMLIASSVHNLPEEFKGAVKGFIELPTLRLSRLGQIKLAVVLGMAQGLITPNDTLVCLAGPPNAHRLDTLLWLTVREELELFAGSERLLVEHVNPEVFEQVLDIAIQLSAEGREGKPVGALFVVGDYENVARYTTQLVLNPFKGYDENERNILDPRLTETVKEFCAIDGAFLIRGDGVIEAAGAFLHPGLPREELPMGLGARHAAAAGITAVTNAIAVTVSASTGTVRVFRGGRMILEIERPA